MEKGVLSWVPTLCEAEWVLGQMPQPQAEEA